MKLSTFRIKFGICLLALVAIIAAVLVTFHGVGSNEERLGETRFADSATAFVSSSGEHVTPDKVAAANHILDGTNTIAERHSGLMLDWRTALTDRRTGWYLKQLSVSASPNDWYRAVALASFCAGTLAVSAADLSKALKEEGRSTKLTANVLSLHGEAQERCLDGEPEWSPPPMLNNLSRRAREAGSQLALAPVLSEKTAKDGFTQAQALALKSLLSDAAARSAWVAVNSSELSQALRSTATFSGITSTEAQAVVFLSLCLSGDDCGPESLYRGLLCNASGYKICGREGVGSSIADSLGLVESKRIEAWAEQLRDAMNYGNLSAIGLLK